MQVIKKPRENISSLLRRFTQRVRESGILVEAKKSQFYSKKQSRGQRRIEAIKRSRNRKAKYLLKKMGRS